MRPARRRLRSKRLNAKPAVCLVIMLNSEVVEVEKLFVAHAKTVWDIHVQAQEAISV
jgi:hypothetical protein